MKIDNLIPMKHRPVVPKNISDNVFINTTCEVGEHRGELLFVALYCISKLVESGDNICGYANIVFTNSDKLSLSQDFARSGGCYLPLVIYPVHVWDKLQLSDWQILTAMLEELCHSLYQIQDEIAVKRKVVSAARIYNSSMNMQLLYPGLNNHP